jgi:hypothetical protein
VKQTSHKKDNIAQVPLCEATKVAKLKKLKAEW